MIENMDIKGVNDDRRPELVTLKLTQKNHCQL